MPRWPMIALVAIVAALPASADLEVISHGLRIPAGFSVSEFAGDDLAHDCYTLTVNPKGQIVVAGRGYIRTLIDDNGDGKADRAIEVADQPKDGAMGLLWEGDTLWCVGDGGLRRFTIGPDGKAVGPSELIRKLKTGGEHDAHALRRGPDGWLYVLCGNTTGISAKDAQRPTSPIREPIAGTVVRFPPDMSYSEIVAHGFRNPYGFDFNGDGELFTFDSDNERCIGLPWYEGCRLYHVVPGGNYGWLAPQRAETWRLPPYFPDVVAPLADLGRGSPTGVACYRHRQFPEKYRGGLFLGDWTFGRIYFASLKPSGSTYAAKIETFLESVGDNGFAPTGLVVHPTTGDLYISIGGRGTRGAVYRIRYEAGVRDATGFTTPQMAKRSLEWRNEMKGELSKYPSSANALELRRAVNDVYRYREHFSSADIHEFLSRIWDDSDRGVMFAVQNLIAGLNRRQQLALSRRNTSFIQGTAVGLGVVAADPQEVLHDRNRTVLATTRPVEEQVDRIRLIQLAFGGCSSPGARGTVWEGYSSQAPVRQTEEELKFILYDLRSTIPSKDALVDREVSRTLAMLADGDPKAFVQVAGKLTSDSHPLDDIHYLIVLARLTAPRTPDVSFQVKNALLDLDRKLTSKGINRDTHWPLRIAELHAELARRDPTLNEWLVADLDFPRPSNVVFTRCPGFDRPRAARRFLERARNTRDFAWNAELVTLMGELPAETTRPLLNSLWERGGFEEAILPLLARSPQAVDREKFLDGLRSAQLSQIRVCVGALEKLAGPTDPAELMCLVRVLRALGDTKTEIPVRDLVVSRLQRLSGQSIGPDRAAWTAWLTKAHPEQAARLGGADGVDVAAWKKRFDSIDWNAGSAARGLSAYSKASCASCHSGGQAAGPDLRGIGGRFGRDDLLTAIIQPSKDVSPRYKTVQIVTKDGKTYQGLIVYEATDGVILQTGAAATIRIAGDAIASRSYSEVSMMPVGLIDKLTDGEIADLVAYLKALR